MAMLVNNFAPQIDRMVIDRTGLAGGWDFELFFAPEESEGPFLRELNCHQSIRMRRRSSQPSRSSLGLKLEATKAPVEVLVVDSASRPMLD